MNRFSKLTNGLNLKGIGLEVGPSHNPILRKADGYQVEVIDHLAKGELIDKYRRLGIPESQLSNIEEVDYVWDGRPMSEIIGKQDCYDYIIASHVIEHTPDFVTFLQESEKLLKKGGKLALAVPDKRCCFDFYRPLTTTGEVLQAYIEKRTRPMLSSVFDHFSLVSFKGGNHTWDLGSGLASKLVHDLAEADKIFKTACFSSEYIDIHNWVFVLENFRLISYHLRVLGYIDLAECFISETTDYEFYIQFERGKKIDTIDVNSLLEGLL